MEPDKFAHAIKEVENYYSNPEVRRSYDQAVTKNCYALDGAKNAEDVLRFAEKVHNDAMASLPADVRKQADAVKAMNLTEMTYSQAKEMGKALEPGLTPIANAIDRCKGREM